LAPPPRRPSRARAHLRRGRYAAQGPRASLPGAPRRGRDQVGAGVGDLLDLAEVPAIAQQQQDVGPPRSGAVLAPAVEFQQYLALRGRKGDTAVHGLASVRDRVSNPNVTSGHYLSLDRLALRLPRGAI